MDRPTIWALIAGAILIGIYYAMGNSRSPVNAATAAPGQQSNAAAFLAMLRHSEGTDRYPDPWGTYYGGAQFTDKSNHPVLTGAEQPVSGPSGTTTAAGAYQITCSTWQDLGGVDQYGDFSDASQDQAALDLIERRGATDAMMSGDFAGAVAKLGNEWASLPGSPYGQPTNTLADLESVYTAAGGTLSA